MSRTKLITGRIFPNAFLFLLFIGVSVLQAQTGNVKGRVTSFDGKPAESISIMIEKTAYGAYSDAGGHYEIKNIKPGTYTIAISIVGTEKKATITVTANATVIQDFTIDRTAKELEEIIVVARQNRRIAKESDQIARMPLANLQNPQVYSIVGKELMKEQVVVTITDALKSAPGIIPTTYPSGGIGVTSRGFSTEVSARNGLQSTLGRAGADVVNIERIEFIKGPSGTLFGAGISSFGGVVNLVTKKPQEKFAGSVDFTMGSFGLARLTADINTPISADTSVLLRVNGALTRQNSFSSFGFNNSVAFAPSLSYKVNDKFSLLLDAEFYNVNSTRPTYTIVDPASGYTNYKDIPMGFRESYYDNDLDSKTQSQKFFVEGRYKFNDNWQSSTNIAYVNEQVSYSYQTYNTWVGKNEVSRWAGIWGPVRNTYINAQQNFTGKFKTGTVKHTLLVGLTYTNYISDGMGKYSPDFDTIDVTKPYNLIDRTYADKILLQPENVNHWGRITNDFLGAYVSDVVNFGDRLYAMLSLRADRYIQTQGGLWGEPFKQNALSPKLGLVYQVIQKKLSVFANYMSGFQNSAPVTQPDGSMLTIKPIYANQWEAGVKAELFNKFSSTFSYYHIAIDNALRTDNNLFTRQDGEQVSKGFEWELLSNPVDGLSIMLGYGYNENKIVKAAANEGNLVAGTPKNMVNAWISYKLSKGKLRGLGFGGGGNYVSECFFNETNTVTIPSYTVLNATVFYETGKIRIGAKFNNITNEKYWDNWGIYNPTSNFAVDLSFKF